MDIHSLIPIAKAATEAAAEAENQGIASTLGINWKLFIAQLFNFAIIILILWKFVFGAVAKRLEARTKHIEESLSNAEKIEQERAEFTQWKSKEMNEARKQAAEVVSAAQAEAQKVREDLLVKTRHEQEKLVSQAKEQIESEKNKALQEAKAEIADMVTDAAEKILRTKLDEKKDKELIKESLSQLR